VPSGAGRGEDTGEAAVRGQQLPQKFLGCRRTAISLTPPVDREDAEEDQGNIEGRPCGEGEVPQEGDAQGKERQAGADEGQRSALPGELGPLLREARAGDGDGCPVGGEIGARAGQGGAVLRMVAISVLRVERWVCSRVRAVRSVASPVCFSAFSAALEEKTTRLDVVWVLCRARSLCSSSALACASPSWARRPSMARKPVGCVVAGSSVCKSGMVLSSYSICRCPASTEVKA
jgi:hypothetical protein